MEETELGERADRDARLKQLFLRVVEKGEKKGVMLALESSDVFDVNCQDKDGRNALTIAMQNGNIEIMELLARHRVVDLGDILLRAVHSQNIPMIEVLCEALKLRALLPDGLNCHSINNDFHENITPTILACHQNNYVILKLLLNYGASIQTPSNSKAAMNGELSLQHSVGTINIYRAITSEAYISLTSEDPLLQAFKLSAKMSQLSYQDFEFRAEYTAMADRCETYAADLLDYVRNSEEQKTIMTHGSGCKTQSPKPAKVSDALTYDQRKFVAHSVCQQYLTEKWYSGFARWRWQSDLEVFVQACLIGLCYPFLALCYIASENLYFARMLKTPYIRFIGHVASLLVFLLLLTLHLSYSTPEQLVRTTEDGVVRATLVVTLVPEPVEILIIIWIVALTWALIHQLWSKGMKCFSYNKQAKATDIVTLVLFWSWMILRTYAGIKTYVDGEGALGSNQTTVANDSLIYVDTGYTGSDDLLCVIPEQNEDTFANLVNTMGQLYDSDGESQSALECILKDALFQLNENVECETGEGGGGRRRRAARVAFRPKPGSGSGSGQAAPQHSMTTSLFDMSATHPILVAESLFALAKVLSFLGLARMTVAHLHMGPMQISFGRMGSDIGKFLVIFALILFAFAVGMNQLYYMYSFEVHYHCQQQQLLQNEEWDPKACLEQPYKSLLSSLATLFWTVFGMSDVRDLKMTLSDRWFTEVIANFLFALYQVLAVIVLLNILIAMMSNTYQRVADDEDIQWKYSRSLLWLNYYEESAALPPPFNLIPSVDSMKRLVKRVFCTTVYCGKKKRLRAKYGDDVKSAYKTVMRTVVDRYVFDKLVTEEPADAMLLQLKQDMYGFKDDMFSTLDHMDDKMSKIHHSVDEGAEEGEKATVTDLMKDFSSALTDVGPIRPEAFAQLMGVTDEITFAEEDSMESSGED